MIESILILCGLVWIPISLYYVIRHDFITLLVWMIVCPVVVNIIEKPGRNPFFTLQQVEEVDYVTQEREEKRTKRVESTYISTPTTVKTVDLLQPTRSLLLILFVVLLLKTKIGGKTLQPLNWTEIWMLVFSLILVVNVLLLSKRVLNNLRVSMDAFMIPFLAYYVTRRLVTDAQRWRQLVKAMGYLGGYLIILALLERVLNTNLVHRLQGPFEFRDLLYITLMTVFFIALADANATPQTQEGALPATLRKFLLCLAPVIIFLTWTRGNWLGFLIAIWLFVYFARHLVQFSKKLILVGLVLMLVPIGFVAAQAFTPQDVIDNRIANDRTMYGRLGAWQISLQAGIKHPVLGIGLNNLREVLESTQVWIEGKRSAKHAHNSFLAIFVETGILGLTAYLGVVVSIFYTGWRIYRTHPYRPARWWGIALVAVGMGHFFSSLTSTILYKSDIAHVYVFVCLGGITGLYGGRYRHRVPGVIEQPLVGDTRYPPERIGLR